MIKTWYPFQKRNSLYIGLFSRSKTNVKSPYTELGCLQFLISETRAVLVASSLLPLSKRFKESAQCYIGWTQSSVLPVFIVNCTKKKKTLLGIKLYSTYNIMFSHQIALFLILTVLIFMVWGMVKKISE